MDAPWITMVPPEIVAEVAAAVPRSNPASDVDVLPFVSTVTVPPATLLADLTLP